MCCETVSSRNDREATPKITMRPNNDNINRHTNTEEEAPLGPTLDTELQAANDCCEWEKQSSPAMSLQISYVILSGHPSTVDMQATLHGCSRWLLYYTCICICVLHIYMYIIRAYVCV